MDTTTPHGELLFSIFGALAQYERALTTERVNAGLAAAKRRGRRGGRPFALDPERVQRIVEALEGGASKASVCRSFKVPRSTLLDTLARIGWSGPTGAAAASTPRRRRVGTPAQDEAPSPAAGEDRDAGDGDARHGRGGDEQQRGRPTRTTTVVLWLRVENNSKFVRGKTRVRERIETYHLARYGMVKLRGWEYELTVPYESDAELDETMDDLIRGMADEADLRHCFIEHDIREKGTDRYW